MGFLNPSCSTVCFLLIVLWSSFFPSCLATGFLLLTDAKKVWRRWSQTSWLDSSSANWYYGILVRFNKKAVLAIFLSSGFWLSRANITCHCFWSSFVPFSVPSMDSKVVPLVFVGIFFKLNLDEMIYIAS